MIPIFYHDIVTPSGHPGDEVISALQKFIRRGETELAVRAAYELYLTGEEMTAYLWRRLLVISAEDVGLGEPMAPVVVDALHRSSRELSRDSSDYQLLFVHAVRYLCACRKERGSSVLASVVKRRIRRGDPFPLPDYVYEHRHTLTGQERGRTSTTSWPRPPVSGRGSGLRRRSWRSRGKMVFDAPVKFSIVIYRHLRHRSVFLTGNAGFDRGTDIRKLGGLRGGRQSGRTKLRAGAGAVCEEGQPL